jgi:hypothetical protein
MDILVMGNFLLEKRSAAAAPEKSDGRLASHAD